MVFDLLMTFTFHSWYLTLECAKRQSGASIQRGKNGFFNLSKYNYFMKRLWHRPSVRVARSGLWLRVWASRNCLLEESKRLSASIPALRAGKARARVETKEACRRLVGSMWTGGSAREHSRSQDSLSCFLKARERTLGTRLVAGAFAWIQGSQLWRNRACGSR